MYRTVADSSLGDTNETYRFFLFSLFDLFTTELPYSSTETHHKSRLFPGDQILVQVLEEINNPEIESLWGEDETIGWIYQYFNSAEERKKMRDESSAPEIVENSPFEISFSLHDMLLSLYMTIHWEGYGMR